MFNNLIVTPEMGKSVRDSVSNQGPDGAEGLDKSPTTLAI
jgi:hypothetical protein